MCLVILGVPFTVEPTGRCVLQAGVLTGELVGAVFYWGNAGSLIFPWVEEVDSLLPAARVWGGESRGGHSASALASPLCPGHSPTHSAPHRASLQSCPKGGVCQESGTGRIGTGCGAWRLSSPLSSSPFLLESQWLSSPALGVKTFLACKSGEKTSSHHIASDASCVGSDV